ncbi:cation transporter E1-E2 family ATPase [Salmonella phage 18-India]|nr:cation transporter E1-E2 family ATPase [Salmonella phage 18-India]
MRRNPNVSGFVEYHCKNQKLLADVHGSRTVGGLQKIPSMKRLYT